MIDEHPTSNKNPDLVVVIEDGCLHKVVRAHDGVKGLTVEVRDYDTDGVEPDILSTDSVGNPCIISTWEL